MRWLQISGGSHGLSQTLRRGSFLITHSGLMSGPLTLLCVCLPAREITKPFCERLVLISEAGMPSR